jgi:hypothetical protein
MILFSPDRSGKTTRQISADLVRIAANYRQQVSENFIRSHYDPVALVGVSDHLPLLLNLEPTKKQ